MQKGLKLADFKICQNCFELQIGNKGLDRYCAQSYVELSNEVCKVWKESHYLKNVRSDYE